MEERARRELDVRRENSRITRDPKEKAKAKEKAKRKPGNQEKDKYIVIILFPIIIYIIYF